MIKNSAMSINPPKPSPKPPNSFHQMNLSSSMQETLHGLHFLQPTTIQIKSIPLLLGAKTDFIGLAATGTGKTAAYGIPLIENLKKALKPESGGGTIQPQALVLCPTRELALQVSEQLSLFSRQQNIRITSVYGGAPYREQMNALKRGAHIVVGTPGRIIDHMKRKTLVLDGVHTLVLDEADKMISMGFKEELEFILENIPQSQKNTWLFSATLEKNVRKVADRYLKNPKTVHINQDDILSKTVNQLFFTSKEINKIDVLCKLIDSSNDFYGIVFCQTKAAVSDLSTRLSQRKYKVESLHGDKDQKTREKILKSFKSKQVRILVCTDVASRGLDIKDVTHVVNYSLPEEPEVYVHRIGRTARCGKEGVAMSLITPRQRNYIYRIEKMTRSTIKEGKIPSQKEIAQKKTTTIMEKFESLIEFERVLDVLSSDWKDKLQHMKPTEIAARFLLLQNPELYKKPEVLLNRVPSDY